MSVHISKCTHMLLTLKTFKSRSWMKYFEISFYAYKLVYSTDLTDNERTIYNVPDFFPELLHRKARGNTDAFTFTVQKAGRTTMFTEFGLSFMYSESICKTAFINTSHIIRKHEYIFGILTR